MISITKNENKILIKYSGELIHNSNRIFLLYKGKTEEYKELEMVKNENAEYILELNDIKDDICYYFKNDKGEEDNNFGKNYYYEALESKNANIIVVEEKRLDIKRKKLRKTYIWSKKIKLAVYKLMISLPRFITGNYRRRINL